MSAPTDIIASPVSSKTLPSCAPCPECGHCCAARVTVASDDGQGSFWGFLGGVVITCVLGGMVWLAGLTG